MARAGETNHVPPIYVAPMDVSFEGISLSELPCTDGYHSGYYNNFPEAWGHAGNGVGWYYNVKEGNLWFVDKPYGCEGLGPWSSGILVWDDPIGWNERNAQFRTECAAVVPVTVKQVLTINANGDMLLLKLGHWAWRSTNDCRVIDGVLVKEGEK